MSDNLAVPVRNSSCETPVSIISKHWIYALKKLTNHNALFMKAIRTRHALNMHGLIKERCNSIVNKLKLHIFCTSPLICKPTMPSQFMSIPQEFSMIFPEDVWPKNTNVFLRNTIVSEGLCYFLWIWFPVCWLAVCLIYTWTFYDFSSCSHFCSEDISWGDIYPSSASWLKPLSRTSWHDSANPMFYTPAHHGKSNK